MHTKTVIEQLYRLSLDLNVSKVRKHSVKQCLLIWEPLAYSQPKYNCCVSKSYDMNNERSTVVHFNTLNSIAQMVYTAKNVYFK